MSDLEPIIDLVFFYMTNDYFLRACVYLHHRSQKDIEMMTDQSYKIPVCS